MSKPDPLEVYRKIMDDIWANSESDEVKSDDE
jgi:hypothetical protein